VSVQDGKKNVNLNFVFPQVYENISTNDVCWKKQAETSGQRSISRKKDKRAKFTRSRHNTWFAFD